MGSKNKKEYYVDFGSWHINAKDSTDAMKKAQDMIRDGDIPCIDSVDEV